jgi:hypothetical protein
MGMGKSYISYFLACKAYAKRWLMLYIADATCLNERFNNVTAEKICKFFLALNKDILTATDLALLMRHADDSKISAEESTTSIIFGDLLQQENCKTLLIIDEHGALFEKETVPNRLTVLGPLMHLNYWKVSCKGVCVIFMGTTHAKYEKEYITDNQSKLWIIFVNPLQSDVFDALLEMHKVMRI